MFYYTKRVFKHLSHFWPIILIFALLIVATGFSFAGNGRVFIALTKCALILLVLILCVKPLNAVYGLMGTSGSVSLFFINLIVFCFVFSGIYYVGFFRTAGVSYDINQPHVDYNLFTDSVYVRKLSFIEFFDNSIHDVTVTRSRIGTPEIVILYEKDGMSVKDTVIRRTLKREEYSYQSISYDVVLRNTVLTFLMQEPTDLFVVASTYNAAISEPDQSIEIDKQKSELFHWILIFQILVSWIFFGVFISLLYSKFRYES